MEFALRQKRKRANNTKNGTNKFLLPPRSVNPLSVIANWFSEKREINFNIYLT